MSPGHSTQPFGARSLAAATLVALALAWPGAARAAHPLITDDTATQGAGHGQLEVTGQVAREREVAGGLAVREQGGELALTFTLGLHDALDAAVSFPTSYARVEVGGVQQASASGSGDLVVEVKWRLLDAAGFSLAVKPGLTLPTGDAASGLGTGRPCGNLLLAASQVIGPLTFHLNAGYGRNQFARAEERLEHRLDLWQASLAAQGLLLPDLTLVGNLGVSSNCDRGTSGLPLFALAGLIYAVEERLDLDLGVKAGRVGHETELALLAGLAARF